MPCCAHSVASTRNRRPGKRPKVGCPCGKESVGSHLRGEMKGGCVVQSIQASHSHCPLQLASESKDRARKELQLSKKVSLAIALSLDRHRAALCFPLNRVPRLTPPPHKCSVRHRRTSSSRRKCTSSRVCFECPPHREPSPATFTTRTTTLPRSPMRAYVVCTWAVSSL